MRIIGGTHKGRLLKRVGKNTTRETADMVKVAVFNMIGPMEGVVLDLFAGSGAYGLESISRGASFAYLVDHDKDAILTIKDNAKQLGLLKQVSFHKMDANNFIKGNQHLRFDYVFLDPPYQLDLYQDLLIKLEALTNPGATIICESDKKNQLPESTECWTKTKDKTYGIKRITFYQKNE